VPAPAQPAPPSTPPRKVLVVDDDADLRHLLALRLKSAGYAVLSADGGESALAELARETPGLVITDLQMAGMDGLALFEAIRQAYPGLPVIILTAHGTIPDAVAATRRGVFGFITKPFEPQHLLQQVAEAFAIGGVRAQSAPWRRELITRSGAMEELLRQAERVAAGEASVFIHGPSGAGKELLARAIHQAGRRAAAPFIAVNCGAIPENLLESELFGHKKGAFTGAIADHQGLFAAAEGGTLFLDEIGDMPLPLQVKLLRVLQERRVRPVGATATVPVDVRVISATHRDLQRELEAGRFREDLFYRLNVVSLSIPPLSERREDIPLLADHFLRQLAERYGKPVHAFAPAALELLVAAPWPGNVRQLLNVVEQTVALAGSHLIPADEVQRALRDEAAVLTSLDEARRQFEYDYLVRLLKIAQGSVTQAARLAQRNRTEFYKLLERHKLDAASFKPAKAG
jgi:two-component system response regulator GlrR